MINLYLNTLINNIIIHTRKVCKFFSLTIPHAKGQRVIMEIEKEILNDMEKMGLNPIVWKCLNNTFSLLFNLDDSFKFLDYCDSNDINVVGADGFRILPDGRQPDLTFIYDAPTTEQNRKFMMRDKKDRPGEMNDIFLEFVLEIK